MTERPPHDWGCELALLMARARNGEAVYMDGSHDPRPSEWKAAREFVDRVRADERSRLIEAVRARCIRDKHRDRHYTPSSWYVCVQCTPFVKILKGEDT